MSIQVAFGFDELKNKRAPSRFLLLRDGPIGWRGLDASLTEAMAAEIIEDFDSQGAELPIDFHHSTLKVERGQASEAPAAGWVKSLDYVPGEGLFGNCEWTEEAAKKIERRQFKYTSPVVNFDQDTGDIYQLHSVALTNKPRTRDQTELLLEAAERLELEINEMADTKTKPRANRRKKATGKAKLVAAQDDVVDDLPAVDPAQSKMAKVIAKLQKNGADLADEAPATAVFDAIIDILDMLGVDTDEADTTDETETDGGGDTEAAERTGGTMTAGQAKLRAEAAAFRSINKRLKLVEAEQQEDRVEKLIDAQIDAGKILPDDEDLIAASRDMFESDEKGAIAFFDAMAPVCEPGSVTSNLAPVSKSGGRQGVILAASQEFADQANIKHTCESTRPRWINQSLRDAGQPLLTADEIKKLEA